MYKINNIVTIIIVIVLGFIFQNRFGWNIGELQAKKRKDTNARSSVLNVYMWVEYIAPEIFSDFEK